MATENIGAIGLSVEVEDVNVEKVTQAVAEALNVTERAANNLGKAVDGMAGNMENAAQATTALGNATSVTADEAERIALGMKVLETVISKVEESMASLSAENKESTDEYKELAESLEELGEIRQQFEDDPRAFISDAKDLEDAAKGARKYGNVMAGLKKVLEGVADPGDIGEVNEEISDLNENLEETGGKVLSLGAQIKIVKEQMAQQALAGQEESEQYKDLLNKLGQLMDIRGDIAAQGAIFSNDDANIQAVNKGLGTYQQSLGLVGDTLGLVTGGENAMADAASAVNDITKAGNTIQSISNALNKDGYIRRVLMTKVTQTQARVEDSLTKAMGGTARAANIAKIATMGLTAAAAAATLGLPFLIMGIEKLIEKWQDAKAAQTAIFEGVGDAVGETVAKIRDLQSQWNDLGDDFKKKKKFVEDNKESFNDLGVSIENVNDAENLLVNNTDIYIQALMARAKANAAQGQLNDKYVELITKRAKKEQEIAEINEKIASGERAAEDARRMAESINRSQYIKEQDLERARIAEAANEKRRKEIEAIRAEIAKDEQEFDKENLGLVNTIKQAQADAARLAAQSGVREIDKKDKKGKDKAAKKDTEVELTEYQRLKAALKEYQDLKAAGYDPRLFEQEQKNLERQIEEYERLHHLVELPKADYSDRIKKMKEFSDKLTEIVTTNREKREEIEEDAKLSESEKKELNANISKFEKSDIELLKAEYGIVGEDLVGAMLKGIDDALTDGKGTITEKIINLRNEIDQKSKETDNSGNQVDNSEEIAKLEARLQSLLAEYNKLKKGIDKTTDATKQLEKEQRKAAIDRLLKGVSDLAGEFQTLGERIGGSTGAALSFIGDLTGSVMAAISSIQNFAELSTKSIEGVSQAVSTAIRAVETASVVLAVISAALQVAQKISAMFKKDSDDHERRQKQYEAYIHTLDILIDRERKLAEALDAQHAAASYDAIGEDIKKQQQASRALLAKNNKMKVERWGASVAFEKELTNIFGNDYKNMLGLDKGLGMTYGENFAKLSVEQYKALQKTQFYATALTDETRSTIEQIIKYEDDFAQNTEDKMAQLNAVSFDEFSNNFLNALMDMDASAADISKSIQEQMRKALIQDMFKKQYAGDLKTYYDKWAAAMENDGQIDKNEAIELNTLRESIVNGATAAAKAINDQFRDTTEEIAEGGLSGAIKGASQESIDLLTGQTNAVRMNQVEAMAIAREQLSALLSIDKNVFQCVALLTDIRGEMQSSKSLRSQGIDL